MSGCDQVWLTQRQIAQVVKALRARGTKADAALAASIERRHPAPYMPTLEQVADCLGHSPPGLEATK